MDIIIIIKTPIYQHIFYAIKNILSLNLTLEPTFNFVLMNENLKENNDNLKENNDNHYKIIEFYLNHFNKNFKIKYIDQQILNEILLNEIINTIELSSTNKYILIAELECFQYKELYNSIKKNKNNSYITSQFIGYYYKKTKTSLNIPIKIDETIELIKLIKYQISDDIYKKISETKTFKSSSSDIGKELIKLEVNWYKYVLNIENMPIPEIYELYDYGYLFNSIYYQNNQFTNFTITQHLHLPQIINKIQLIHQQETKQINKKVFLMDIKYELFDKVKNVIKKVSPIIELYDQDLTKSINNILTKCKNIIIQYYNAIDNYNYTIIHGNLTLSNIYIYSNNEQKEQSSKIIFTNPCGVFGQTKIFGPCDYDYGVLLASILTNEAIQVYSFYLNKYFNKLHYAFAIIYILKTLDQKIDNPEKLYLQYKNAITLDF